MNILCITDQSPGSEQSAIEGIFNGAIQKIAGVQVVYFCRKANRRTVEGQKIILPHKYKRANLFKPLQYVVDFLSTDVVIVRNYFSVLKRVLAQKKQYHYCVGFWESFPHSFRRVFQAKAENKSILRKSIEYRINRLKEKRLLSQCDFYLPITEMYKGQFYPDLAIPYHALPLGVDFSKLPKSGTQRHKGNNGIRRYIYTGTVDQLRKLDVIISAFMEYDGGFVFDIYTASHNPQVEQIKSMKDSRIRLHNPLPRADLFEKMSGYDIGIGLIPDNELYRVSSPSKTLEYYALGMPAIINRLPEYTSLFDHNSAFFCDFSKDSIRDCIANTSRLSKQEIMQKGNIGRNIVRSERDYGELSFRLFNFLKHQHKGCQS